MQLRSVAPVCLALAVMAGSCVTLFRLFKRAGWL